MLARSKRWLNRATKDKILIEIERALTREKYEFGYFVSTDEFRCKTPVQLPTGYVRESSGRRFQGGTI